MCFPPSENDQQFLIMNTLKKCIFFAWHCELDAQQSLPHLFLLHSNSLLQYNKAPLKAILSLTSTPLNTLVPLCGLPCYLFFTFIQLAWISLSKLSPRQGFLGQGFSNLPGRLLDLILIELTRQILLSILQIDLLFVSYHSYLWWSFHISRMPLQQGHMQYRFVIHGIQQSRRW